MKAFGFCLSTHASRASNIIIQGGSSSGSHAGIVGGTGTSTVAALNKITLTPGAGIDADAVIGTTGGGLTLSASNCVGCTVLASDPIGNQALDGGLFGVPGKLILPVSGGAPLVEVDNSIIYAATLATSGGEANTSYSGDAEEDGKGTNPDVKEEGKNDGNPKRNLPMCM